MKKWIAMILALTMVFALAACGGNDAADDTGNDDVALVYAVEAGSAGETAAAENGWEYNSVVDQATALMEVQSGTSDAAIIDLLMAGAMIGENTSYPDLIYTDKLTTEEYGVGCRQGSDLVDVINTVFSATYADGSMQEIAKKYGVQESLCEQPAGLTWEAADGGDVAAIQEKGTLVVGITEFAPMDFKEAGSDEWIGFDADMARLVAEELGVDIEFVVIDWDMKINEINAKNIDCVWNGMTLTNEVLSAMDCSAPYCNNAQVVVVPAK